MSRMIHKGPRAIVRVQDAPTRVVAISGRLRAGETVLGGIARVFADAGCRGGVAFLDGVTCDPMRYVLPALSSDGVHAAWYSDTYAPDGPCRIIRATASVGVKDGQPFLHCHGIWDTPDGTAMGHLLLDSVVSEDCQITGIGALDAWFESRHDPETLFTLFHAEGHSDGPAILARISPGEDVVTAVEQLCADHRITDAMVHGIGSIDHITFADGSTVDCLATELRFDNARVKGGAATLPIDVVDIDGRIYAGTLTRGNNPVGVTLEILIEPSEDGK